ncbi:MAG: AlpA family phage regulatory protein [Thermodesulfobacteriota bacterium]
MENLFLSDRQVGERYGVDRGTVWRWVREGNFPAPVKLSSGCTRWRLCNLEKWEGERSPERRAS